MPALAISLALAVLAIGAAGVASLFARRWSRARLAYEGAVFLLLAMPPLSALAASIAARIEEALAPSVLACIVEVILLSARRELESGEEA